MALLHHKLLSETHSFFPLFFFSTLAVPRTDGAAVEVAEIADYRENNEISSVKLAKEISR